jgi:hypothetical protein
MTVSKHVVAGSVVLVAVAAVGAGAVYCGRDFAEATAIGDFDRAERRAGLLAINDIAPTAYLTAPMAVMALCAAWMLFAHQ